MQLLFPPTIALQVLELREAYILLLEPPTTVLPAEALMQVDAPPTKTAQFEFIIQVLYPPTIAPQQL